MYEAFSWFAKTWLRGIWYLLVGFVLCIVIYGIGYVIVYSNFGNWILGLIGLIFLPFLFGLDHDPDGS